MDKDTRKALRQSKINRRQRTFNVVITIAVLVCISKVTHLDEKLSIFKLKNSNGASENMKGE